MAARISTLALIPDAFCAISFLLVDMRECQDCCFRERSTDDLDADRQSGSCETPAKGNCKR